MGTFEEVRERLLADGLYELDSHDGLQPGVRVRNRGEQWWEARERGTANVLAVLRKEGHWEQKYHRKNVEVIVQRDDGSVTTWADYGTHLTEGTEF